MTRLKISAALVIGVMSLGAPATAAPLTSLSVAAKPMAQDSSVTQARFGRWHGWHGGRYRCRPYCGWGG